MTEPAGPTSVSKVRKAVDRDDTAGRFAPLNVTILDITVSFIEV
jgi:hypothetical protein